MIKATITSKWQVTIPLEVRKRLGLHKGDQIEFDLRNLETVLRPVKRGDDILDKWVGIANGAFPGGSAEMDAWIREMRGDRGDDQD
jgi:AbrB family looped-hinge helix DNA binding protein